MAKIELKNITKIYDGKQTAVKNINLNIEEGEFLTLLGPSGCGKTTLLRIIAGLETPNTGEIWIDGVSAKDIPPAQRDLAMVFQSYALYPHMTVFDNIAIGLKLRKVSRSELEEKVTKTSRLLGIEKFLTRKPRALSGGQRQRVALARAIVRQPKAFLLDEPLSNLDAILREKTRSELKILFSRLKITTIYVTHDQVEAMSLSHRVAVLKDGILQQLGPPDEIYNKPVNSFVAGFVGSPRMNFIKCPVDNHKIKIHDSYSVTIPASLSGLIKSPEIILGVRPEDIQICPMRDKADLLPAEISVVEPLGAQTVITVKLGNQEIKVTEQTKMVDYPDEIYLQISQDSLYLFDMETENLIGTLRKGG